MRLPAAAIVVVALACPCAMAGSPPATAARSWSGADLESLGAALGKSGAPYTQLLEGKTYSALLLRRAVSGDAELHVKVNDFFVVLSGEGEIEVGGRVTGEKAVAPDEKRGEKLVGGARYRVQRGDVLFVPANHWLQVLIPQGHVLQALIIKSG